MKKTAKGLLKGVGVLVMVVGVLAVVTTVVERKAKAEQAAEEAHKPDQAMKIVDAMRNCLEVGDASARSAGEKDQLYRQCWNRAELIGKKK